MEGLLFASDIHLETFLPPEASPTTVADAFMVSTQFPDNKDAAVILAGDISSIRSHRRNLLSFLSQKYRQVCYVAGNHEHWGSPLRAWDFEAKLYEHQFPNVVMSENKKVKVWKPFGEDRPFILATLWTSYGFGDPVLEGFLKTRVDCSVIRETSPEDISGIHFTEKEQILFFLREFRDKDTTLVTHHVPATCIRPRRIPPSTMDITFSSKSNEDILKSEFPPKTWIFGHTHDRWVTQHGQTKLLANPIGYPYEISRGLVELRTDPVVLGF